MRLASLLVLALLPLSPASQGVAPPAADPLARARAAVGIEAFAATGSELRLAGTARYLGEEGPIEARFAADGRFLRSFEGALPDATGFDGTRAWNRDFNGATRVVHLQDRDQDLLLHWVYSGYWAHPDAPVTVEPLPLEDGGGEGEAPPRLHLALDGTPMAMELVLDGETLLPRELHRDAGGGRSTWSFDGWRRVEGLAVAASVASVDEAGVRGSVAWERIEAVPSAGDGAFEPPAGGPGDVAFDASLPAVVEAERTFTGHLLVLALLDGDEEERWFILDTGAGAMCIDEELADDLDLPELGQVTATGVAGHEVTRFRRGESFRLGPLLFEDPVYVELDLSMLTSIFGVEVAGICGYDVFARAVVEVELATARVAFHDPARYELGEGSWQELVLDGRLPCLRGSFEGGEGLFKLDTGSNGTVVFHGPAVERLGLLDGREVEATHHGGVGGFAEGSRGRMAWFELAGHRFEEPRVEFAGAAKGALTDEYTLGTVGQGFLAPFRMVFDYGRERAAFTAR